MPGHDALGVLKQTDAVSEPLQMPERGWRATHAGAPAVSTVSEAASSRYDRATAGQSNCGARSAEYLLIRAESPGSVSTRCSARAMSAGSLRATRSPAPPPRSSTACGNRVDTTGLPAVTASIRTPEVTCSGESYGSSTTSAALIKPAKPPPRQNPPPQLTPP